MLKRFFLALLLVQVAWADGHPKLLLEHLQGMDVVHHWQSGHHRINWRTGDPDPSAPAHDHRSTHCSAFAASACEKLGVYILRPPAHSSALLASAQQDWLNSSQGQRRGWVRLRDGLQARDQANQGQIVVASFKNPDPSRPGHIALVIPSTWSDERVLREGCEIMQAGGHNYLSTTLRRGFGNHRSAFSRNEIQFHSHSIRL